MTNSKDQEPLENPNSSSSAQLPEMMDLKDFYLRRDSGRPAKDCWILVHGIGGGVQLTPEIKKEWLTRARHFRRIRGDFLVAGFEIEYGVDLLISEVLFAKLDPKNTAKSPEPTPTDQVTYRELSKYSFDQLFLKGAENLFGRKINLLQRLSVQFPTLSELVSKDLLKRLHKIMDIRNVFAHYPLIFVQVSDAIGPELRALLMRDESPIELNRSFFDEYTKLFASTESELDNALQRFREGPLKVEPAELKKQARTRMFLGHEDLKMERWLGQEE